MSPPPPRTAARASHTSRVTCERCAAAPATPRARGTALCRGCFEHASPEPTRAELERAWFPNLTGGFDAAPPPCVVCGGGDDEDLVLVCDGPCDRAFHARCVGFQGKVEGDWFCGGCQRARVK